MDPQPGLEPADRTTLERWALADWSTTAEARVDSVVVAGPWAAVNLLLNGDYEYTVTFRRDENGHWRETSSSSGHRDAAELRSIELDQPRPW